MITTYSKLNGTIATTQLSSRDVLPDDTLWVDLHNPTLKEQKTVESQLDITIPSSEEIWKNQVLNRFYVEDGVIYMTAAIITKVDTPHPQTSTITFVLGQSFLLTIRHIAPTSFQNFSQRLMHHPHHFLTCKHVLEGLLEEVITRVAHNSEIVVSELDKLSHDIFGLDVFDRGRSGNKSQLMKEVLKKLGTSADLNSKISESLHSLQRLLSFFRQAQSNDKEIDNAIGILMSDVSALSHQTDFLSDKITFLLDATLGMIHVEQNLIIKIFSVVAVFFLPPTLVSSIYGMNFQHMPELEWMVGYPMAISIMLLCAVVPYMYFVRRGWL